MGSNSIRWTPDTVEPGMSNVLKCQKLNVLSIWHPVSWVIRTILIHVLLLCVVDLVFTLTNHMLKYNCYRSRHFHSKVQHSHLHYIYILLPHDFWNITECINWRHLSINVIGKFLVFNPRQHLTFELELLFLYCLPLCSRYIPCTWHIYGHCLQCSVFLFA